MSAAINPAAEARPLRRRAALTALSLMAAASPDFHIRPTLRGHARIYDNGYETGHVDGFRAGFREGLEAARRGREAIVS